MSSCFVAAICNVPGLPREEFREEVKSQVEDWLERAPDTLGRFLSDIAEVDPWMVNDWEDLVAEKPGTTYAEVIADSMLETWDSIVASERGHSQQHTVIIIKGEQFYLSGGPDYDEPEVAVYINTLAASGFDSLGVE